ncbi:MAG: cytochrome c biogenesis protein CcsA [Thiolinea sp.]
MESLLFQLILAGVVLLTIGLLTGFIYLDGLFGKQVAHKTLLSILAWFTFTTLLYGHWRYGWRGRIAIRWTVTGFILLMLAFWGSKFVIEYVVNAA